MGRAITIANSSGWRWVVEDAASAMSLKNITRRLGNLLRGHQCRTSAFILDASVVTRSYDSANG
jgi:hypothetical protein